MHVFRGFHHPGIAPACALTIGNFDGVHRGHQAMLALLRSEAQHRGLPSCVMTFEPHPRDYFAAVAGKPELAPARIATLRDKLSELERCGVDQTVVLRFDRAFAAQSPQAFIDEVLVAGLGTRYVLVGDDFRFGARRAGDYAMLDAAGQRAGFDVARMNSYEVRGMRVSSSAVREALAAGDMATVATLARAPLQPLRPRRARAQARTRTRRKRGRARRRLSHAEPALLAPEAGRARHLRRAGPRPGRPAARRGREPGTPSDRRRQRPRAARDALPRLAASLGAEGGYGKIVRVELLHKLRDEVRYDGLEALTAAIAQDVDDARAFLAAHAAERRQTTRDRI